MKRLILIPILLISILCNAQLGRGMGMSLRTGSSFTTPPPEPIPDFYDEYDTVYIAFYNRPHIDTATIQEALVYSLDTAGYWDRMDLFYVFASHDSISSLTNWIHPELYECAIITAADLSWTAYQGWLPTGNAGVLNTTFNPSDDGVNATQNDITIGFYIRNNPQTNNLMYGANDGTYIISGVPSNGGSGSYRLNTSGDSQGVTGVADASGLWMNTRRAESGADAIELYRNGSSADTETDASTGVPDIELYIFRSPAGGASSLLAELAIFFVMDAVSDEEAGEINTIIETFMDAIGTGVQ